jgi:hypothetical protein
VIQVSDIKQSVAMLQPIYAVDGIAIIIIIIIIIIRWLPCGNVLPRVIAGEQHMQSIKLDCSISFHSNY